MFFIYNEVDCHYSGCYGEGLCDRLLANVLYCRQSIYWLILQKL